MLDRTEQRIVGVLIEKELSVPDTYPMSENGLVAGCNQTSNRDPVLALESFQVAGALMALQERGFVARVDGGGRVAKFRHRLVDRWALDRQELAVLAELLLRGPQAPGALKPRLQRMGVNAAPDAIEAVLRRMAARPEPLVEVLPRQPREHDHRWRHRLGPAAEAATAPASGGDAAPAPMPAPAPAAGDLESRVAALERQLALLQQQVAALRER